MKNTPDMNDGIVNEIPQNAVSIYGENDNVEDFPVLKAFQQYIDAEQEKARKRMIGLGAFFCAILILVVVVFMFLLHGINVRNQALNDRLVEYAMKQSERPAPAPIVQPAPAPTPSTENNEALKAMTATLTALQQSIQKSNEEKAKQPPVVETPIDPVEDQRIRKANEKIERAKAQLEAERKKIAEERERLRQIEIDRQRRKLYPEYYEDEAPRTRTVAPKKQTSARTLTDEDIREILREAYPEKVETEESDATKPKANEKNEKPPQRTGQAKSDDRQVGEKKPEEKNADEKKTDEGDVDEDDAIEYFKDDDYNIPVNVKGSPSRVRFTIPTTE